MNTFGISEHEWDSALARDPKGLFLQLLSALRLRHQSALFREIAQAVSLPALKRGDGVGRIAASLVRWFGAHP